MDLLLMYGLWFGSVALVGVASYQHVAARASAYLQKKSVEASAQLGEMFISLSRQHVWVLYALAPFAVGGLTWLLTEKWWAGAIGLVGGIVVPSAVITHMDRAQRKKFHAQLVDGLLLLSSSLKAGLSMLQSFTVVAEEMPQPLSQEFGLILKEARMGVNLDEAVKHLTGRMPSDDTTLFVTAVLVAREAGGDVTHIFARLVETLRDRKKIKEKIKTLTFMARLQGIIMGMLPFVFSWVVYQMDHNYFRYFLNDPMGRMMLVTIIVLQIIGTIMFVRFSRSPL